MRRAREEETRVRDRLDDEWDKLSGRKTSIVFKHLDAKPDYVQISVRTNTTTYGS